MPKLDRKPPLALYIGIDPGVNGGLAFLSAPPGGGAIGVTVVPMPATEADLWAALRPAREFDGPKRAVIEWIHPAIQHVAKSRMSKLYGNYSACRMALTASSIPFYDVMPRKWQAHFGVSTRSPSETTTKWKDRLRGKAQSRYPSLECWEWKLEKQRCVSDALLIAEYCREHA